MLNQDKILSKFEKSLTTLETEIGSELREQSRAAAQISRAVSVRTKIVGLLKDFDRFFPEAARQIGRATPNTAVQARPAQQPADADTGASCPVGLTQPAKSWVSSLGDSVTARLGMKASCQAKIDRVAYDGNVVLVMPAVDVVAYCTQNDIPVSQEFLRETNIVNHPVYLNAELTKHGMQPIKAATAPKAEKRAFKTPQPPNSASQGDAPTEQVQSAAGQKAAVEQIDEPSLGAASALASLGRQSA